MDNSDFEKKKIATMERHLKERKQLDQYHQEINASFAKDDVPKNVQDKQKEEINKMNNRHHKEISSLLEGHESLDKGSNKEENKEPYKEKDKDRDREK